MLCSVLWMYAVGALYGLGRNCFMVPPTAFSPRCVFPHCIFPVPHASYDTILRTAYGCQHFPDAVVKHKISISVHQRLALVDDHHCAVQVRLAGRFLHPKEFSASGGSQYPPYAISRKFTREGAAVFSVKGHRDLPPAPVLPIMVWCSLCFLQIK